MKWSENSLGSITSVVKWSENSLGGITSVVKWSCQRPWGHHFSGEVVVPTSKIEYFSGEVVVPTSKIVHFSGEVVIFCNRGTRCAPRRKGGLTPTLPTFFQSGVQTLGESGQAERGGRNWTKRSLKQEPIGGPLVFL